MASGQPLRQENSEFLRRVGAVERDTREVAELARAGVELAREALIRIEGHEARCGDRYVAIAESNALTAAALTRIHERIDGLIGRWFWFGAGLIGVLISIIGYLLAAGVPWQ